MPVRASSLTGASGEHFVAYVLSAFGYPVALTRGGSPTVDLLVGDLKGKSAISIQVKTSNWAWRSYKRKPEKNHWEWDVGKKALTLKGESIYYAFVDLKWDAKNPTLPDVFIVPSREVADWLGPNWTRYIFWIMEKEKGNYFNKWDTIIDKLKG